MAEITPSGWIVERALWVALFAVTVVILALVVG